MVSACEYMSCGSRPSRRAIQSTFRPAFTLVELLVSLVIISILASLSLAGLAAVRTRGKADKTRSTIRKLHEIIMPQYESYLDRRVMASGVTGTAAARERTRLLRLLMAREMPHRWQEVYPPASLPGDVTAAPRAFTAFWQSVVTAKGAPPTQANEGAECLFMIVMRGGFAAEDVEQFRSDETGDIDNDGAAEFFDGWGQPISFIRWPTGFLSSIQRQDASVQPDPFDPMGASDIVNYPTGRSQPDYAVFPLVVSQGPDGAYSGVGLQADTSVWTTLLASGSPPGTLRVALSGLPGEITDPDAAADNITNHDLNAR